MARSVAVRRYQLVSQTLVTSAGDVSLVDVGFEAIFVRPIAIPKGARLLGGELNLDN
jgi:hypothetical protein